MVSFYLGLLILAFCSLPGHAQNINCGLRTRRVITVENATSYTLTTQRKGEEKYKDKTECRVLYKQGPTCRTIQFSCSQVAVKAKWKQPSSDSAKRFCFGDYMRVRRYGESTRYCRGSKPSFNSTGPITVFFKSDPQIVSTGAVCKIECIEDTSEWKGVIESPGYPGTYNDDIPSAGMNTLTVAPGYFIQFTYVVFELPCSDGYITLENDSDGNQFNSGRDCGSKQDTDVFVSNDNKVWWSVTLNPPYAHMPGLKIKWEAVPDPTLRIAMDYNLEELEKDYSW